MNQRTYPPAPLKSASDILAAAGQIIPTKNKVGKHWPGTTMFTSKLQAKKPLDTVFRTKVYKIRAEIAEKKAAQEHVRAIRAKNDLLPHFSSQYS